MRERLASIKKTIEKGKIAEASNKVIELHNKIYSNDENKLIRINVTSDYEIFSKHKENSSDQCCSLSCDSNSDNTFNKKEKFKLLETETKISKYQEELLNELSNV